MKSPCSIPLLELALAGNLPADDECFLHRHLEECEECSAALERMAAGAAWRQEVASLLPEDELDEAMASRDEWSEVDFTVEHLEPADEPNVLGRLGGYDVLEIIGHGGMGVVLKGFDRELKRCVAIKVLAPHLARSSLAKKRFAREAQAAAAVVHPHVLAIHQVQPNGPLPFLVMPLVAGESLAQRIATQGTLELKEILRIGMQAAAGLAAAHGQGLIHRDVKPANILLEMGVERAMLTDFGLARAADDVSMTRWGIIAGTPQYMSPEQAKGEPLDGRSDLFSLGCVLYEMATGVSPFRTDSAMATMRRLVDESPQAMASLNPELPPWFIAIVDRLLMKDPSRRFNFAREVSELLEGCLAHVQQPGAVPLPASLVPHTARGRWNFTSNRKGVISMFGALGLTLLTVVLWQISQSPESQPSIADAPTEDAEKLQGNWVADKGGSYKGREYSEEVIKQDGHPWVTEGKTTRAMPQLVHHSETSERVNASDALCERPSITVVFPSIDEVLKDLKLAFDLVGDTKGFTTLRETVETFLVGVDTSKAGGVRTYPTSAGLQSVLSFPVKSDAEFMRLISNLWDLDIKTAPAPKPQLIRQIPPAVTQKLARLRLEKNERLIFRLFDGFMRYESGQVHLGKQLEDVGLAKGTLPVDLVKGHDLAIWIDGMAQAPEKRKTAFEKAKTELIGALTKGESESEAAFAARKSLTEHQIAEFERFFVESSKILIGWNVSEAEKQATLDIDMESIAGTAFEKSVELLSQTPDEFAGVSKKDAIFSLSLNFALDPLRQAFVKDIANLERKLLKKEITESEKRTAEEKAVDSDLVDLVFDLVEGTSKLGIANAFVRSWKNTDGSLSTVTGGRITAGAKATIEKMLDDIASRSPDNKVEKKIETEGEIEIHKLTVPRLHTELPEFIGSDGAIFVGTHENSVWLASGEKALELLKAAIKEAKDAGPKPGPDLDLSVNLGPYVHVLNSYRTRNPQVKAAPAAKAADGKKKVTKVKGLISTADLRKLALEAFKEGKDTVTLSIHREEKQVKLKLKFEEGCLRFAGKVLSKFVKENLEDE